MAQYDNVPTAVHEVTIPEAANAVQAAAIRATKASEAFLSARIDWREARADLSSAWQDYVAARDRQDETESLPPQTKASY